MVQWYNSCNGTNAPNVLALITVQPLLTMQIANPQNSTTATNGINIHKSAANFNGTISQNVTTAKKS